MRTTVTLDDDAEQMIREEMRRTQRSFKVTLNEAVRNGLRRIPDDTEGFQMRARPLGLRTGIDSARMHERDQDAEEERFLRVTHRALRSERWSFRTLLEHDAGDIDVAIDLLESAGAGGDLTTDSQIGALALRYRATVHTADTDFSRLRDVRWRNPLTGQHGPR